MKKISKKTPVKKYQTGGVKPYTGGVKLYDGKVTLAGSNKVVGTAGTATPKPKPKPTPKPTPKPVAKPKSKTVINSKGKTVYSDGIKTVYDSKGRTTTYSGGVKEVLNKKGKTVYFPDGKKTVVNKNGETVYFPDGHIRISDKQGVRRIPSATSSAKPTTKPATPAKTTPKQVTKPAITKPAAKTVSQMWVEKTGTPWSEAKKQGFSDGTAASNMALMKKLQTGNRMEFMSSGYKIPSEDEARAMDDAYDAAYGPAKTTMRRGGRVKSKMKSKKK